MRATDDKCQLFKTRHISIHEVKCVKYLCTIAKNTCSRCGQGSYKRWWMSNVFFWLWGLVVLKPFSPNLGLKFYPAFFFF